MVNLEKISTSPVFRWGVFGFIVLVVAYYLGSRTGKAKTSGNNSISGEISKSALSYDLSQYVSFADRLQAAMYGFTDDEDAVYDVFSKMQTKSDVLQLITTFGNRRPIWHFGTTGLPIWINTFFAGSEIQHINEILAKNNIDYQF